MGYRTVTGIGPLDALINGVVITLSSIGGVFGLSGSNATVMGVMVVVMAVAAFGIIMGSHQDQGYKNCKQTSIPKLSSISWRTSNSTTAKVAGSG